MNIKKIKAISLFVFALTTFGCVTGGASAAKVAGATPTVDRIISLHDWESEVAAIGETLKTDGVIGLVHGANPERGLYVFEYNKPDDFFKRYYFSLISKDRAALKTLHRGDRIQVWGKLGAQESPQPHIISSKFQMIQAYNPNVQSPGGQDPQEAVLPDELKNQTEIVVQVHAVVADGQVLVVEYKDAILPVVVDKPDNEQTRDLFRGDLIRLPFELQSHPHQPTHVVYRPRAKAPYFDMIQRLVERHGKAIRLEGALTLFPKSPVINQDIWAIEEDLGYGLHRYSTLVNFDQDPSGEMTEWTKLKAKLRAVWDANPSGVVKGRNKFINRKVRISANGIQNVVSPAQANAQLFLKADDIKIISP